MSDAQERRRLGAPTLIGLVIANMVGAGLFTTSGFALADLGTPQRVLLAWAIGGVIAVLGVLNYGALAGRLQESGGEYLFLSRTLHPSAGFLAGWISLLAGFGGAIALAAEALQAYLVDLLPAGFPPDLIGTVLIIGAGLLHAVGLRPGAMAQNAMVAAKLLLLLLFAAAGLFLVLRADPSASAAAAVVETPAFNLPGFVTSLMWISLSYSGWNAAIYVAGEVRDPRRTIPRAMLLGTLLVTGLYLVLNYVLVHAAPIETLAGEPAIALVAAEALSGPGARESVRIVMAIAMLTSIASMTMIGPRVYAKMADDGLLPRFLRFAGEVPRAAIALQVVVAVSFLWLSELRGMLANLGWLLSLCTAAAVIGLLRLRRAEGAERVPIPGYPWVPLAFVGATLTLSVTMILTSGLNLIPALVVLGSGALAYLFVQRPS